MFKDVLKSLTGRACTIKNIKVNSETVDNFNLIKKIASGEKSNMYSELLIEEH